MTVDPSLIPDSGFFTDYDGTVKDAYFGPWEKSKDPNALFLWLKMETDSVDRPEWDERLSLGQGWRTDDGGETVVNDRGGVKFNMLFSGYAKWLNAAVPLLEQGGALEKFMSKGEPGKVSHTAKVWVGTRWHVGEQVEEYTIKKGDRAGEKGTMRQNVPEAFLGWAGEGNGQVGSAVDLSFVPEDLLGKLQSLARASASKDGWIDKIMTDAPEVRAVDGLVGKLSSEKVYQAMKVEG